MCCNCPTKIMKPTCPIQILHRLHCRVFIIEIMCWAVLILLLGAQRFLIMIIVFLHNSFEVPSRGVLGKHFV